ncbi:hypothetical protein AAFF_G00017770 [Aldrovandia affinis]|uniref:Uncharacterized protein n=1 Tax=Aldrovandia affinis TaxID=143900 RepID=A0AAD7S811_9TELE|nr:hypothetical protein AAFF_G00017770 [Aldrovandia affinis]
MSQRPLKGGSPPALRKAGFLPAPGMLAGPWANHADRPLKIRNRASEKTIGTKSNLLSAALELAAPPLPDSKEDKAPVGEDVVRRRGAPYARHGPLDKRDG